MVRGTRGCIRGVQNHERKRGKGFVNNHRISKKDFRKKALQLQQETGRCEGVSKTTIKFLGGAEEVGRLAIKIKMSNSTFMIDYGVIPEKPPEYPLPYEPVEGIFVTHAHLDHIGALPICYHNDMPDLYATSMTASSMRPLLEDSLKIMDLEGYPARFNEDDVASLYGSVRTVRYGDAAGFGNITAVPYSAGHIPGSSMWRFENSESLLVTGDLYTRDTFLLTGAKAVKADT